jgi:hypothetical protein
MTRLGILAAATFSLVSLAGCADRSTPTGPAGPVAAAPSLDRRAAATTPQIAILDQCDPDSFNHAIGAGTCVGRTSGVKFDAFLQQIRQFGGAPGWRFWPSEIELRLGGSFTATNMGGEVHTFTEVDHFGGGVVPRLNDLSGNHEVAKECLALANDDFLPPGGKFHDTPDAVGTELYQCRIHPWMRAVVHVTPRG